MMVRLFTPRRPESSEKGLQVASRISNTWKGILGSPGEDSPSVPIEEGRTLYTMSGSPGDNDNEAAYTLGYQFSVGPSSLTMLGVRTYLPNSFSTKAFLWDTSENILGEIDITTVANSWVLEAFSSSIELSANTNYIIGVSLQPGNTRYSTRSLSNFTFLEEVSFVDVRFNSSPNSFPGSVSGSGNMLGLIDGIII